MSPVYWPGVILIR